MLLLILFYSIDTFSQSIEKKDDNTIYSKTGIDVVPKFPEGLEKLNSYVNENFQQAGFEKQVKGKFYSIFVIEKDGSLSDIKILGKVNSRIAEELIRILKIMPKWNSGINNGITVRVLNTFTIVIEN